MTGPYHGDPVAHAASQECCVITYMTDDVAFSDTEPFGMVFRRYSMRNGLGFGPVGRWSGNWREWGAFCITKWGGWFERIDGSKRRERQPLQAVAIECRVKQVLASNGELGIGTIKNRLRSVAQLQVLDTLANLVKRGEVIEYRYKHPINKVETASYRLFDTVADAM
jgi:hypothetical protein